MHQSVAALSCICMVKFTMPEAFPHCRMQLFGLGSLNDTFTVMFAEETAVLFTGFPAPNAKLTGRTESARTVKFAECELLESVKFCVPFSMNVTFTFHVQFHTGMLGNVI